MQESRLRHMLIIDSLDISKCEVFFEKNNHIFIFFLKNKKVVLYLQHTSLNISAYETTCIPFDVDGALPCIVRG